jgi:hypothetical protein
MKSGYLYVLVHPSDPDLHKIGVTILRPEKRAAQHNRQHDKHAGRIVKETGQKWELKTYIAVPDPYWAENAFWGGTHFSVMPHLGGIEVQRMEWQLVQKGLDAAMKAGARPPPKLPDHVYAYTASVKKRLEGRGITLIGHVKSKISGRNNFQCSNGHVWRTIPNKVAEGEGCPQCGMGQRTPDEIRQAAKSGVICLLIHPNKPGLVKIGLTYRTLKQCDAENIWGDWQVHRYRNVEESVLAESLIWELLGYPLPNDREPISIDLQVAEEAFRKLHYRLVSEIALAEKAKE